MRKKLVGKQEWRKMEKKTYLMAHTTVRGNIAPGDTFLMGHLTARGNIAPGGW